MKAKLTSAPEFRLDHTMIRASNLEITYNWDQLEDYTRGNAWGYLAMKVPAICPIELNEQLGEHIPDATC